MPAMKTEKTLSVSVDGWSRSRTVEVRGNKVAMEIARVSCSHCATCSRRMDTITGQVHRAGLEVEWERVGGGHFIVIPLPKNANPVRHLAKVLDLCIR